MGQTMGGDAPGSGAERGEAQEPADGTWRGRPGRRSAEDHTAAVMDLLSGKATVDHLAARFGVRPEVIEKWWAASEAVAYPAAPTVSFSNSTRTGSRHAKIS